MCNSIARYYVTEVFTELHGQVMILFWYPVDKLIRLTANPLLFLLGLIHS
jgi:hypothetical protein